MRPALTVLAAVLLALLPTAIAPTAQAAPAAETLPLAEAVRWPGCPSLLRTAPVMAASSPSAAPPVLRT